MEYMFECLPYRIGRTEPVSLADYYRVMWL
jgi:hypothetical protein